LRLIARPLSWVIVERLSWTVVIFGIPLFFIEQNIRSQHERENNTLEFAKKYQDSQMVTYRFALLAPWMQYNIREMEAARPSRRVVDDFVMKLIEVSKDSGKDADMRAAIFGIVDFYETLMVCVETARCDKQLAISYFEEYGRKFYCLYRPYILKLRDEQRVASYGQRLEQLALLSGQCP